MIHSRPSLELSGCDSEGDPPDPCQRIGQPVAAAQSLGECLGYGVCTSATG
jgi:hypothetical protein